VPGATIVASARPVPLAPRLTDEARAAHRHFVASLGEAAIWRDYVSLD
jgi:DNA polymerase III subunit epsilon